MKLKDLFETPKIINGDIVLPPSTKKLAYEGAIVKGSFNCHSAKITSLKGAPSYVGGSFYCFSTPITSLQGAPTHVGGDFYCNNTKIKSLQNIHKQIKYIGGDLYLPPTIKSHILGVMFIKGLQSIAIVDGNSKQKQVQNIINKHLKGDRNPHDAQEELIEAGLSEYAKL